MARGKVKTTREIRVDGWTLGETCVTGVTHNAVLNTEAQLELEVGSLDEHSGDRRTADDAQLHLHQGLQPLRYIITQPHISLQLKVFPQIQDFPRVYKSRIYENAGLKISIEDTNTHPTHRHF